MSCLSATGNRERPGPERDLPYLSTGARQQKMMATRQTGREADGQTDRYVERACVRE